MPAVTYNGINREVPEGMTYLALARELEPESADEILLVRANGTLKELLRTVGEDETIAFVTAHEPSGRKTYERSAILLLLRAFYDVVPSSRIEKIQIGFSLGDGLYGELHGEEALTPELLSRVKERMEELVAMRLPIGKRSVNTADAVELFHHYGMHDKEALFHYRLASMVNLYRLGDYEDYFYGYMVPDTGYLRYFDLVPYQEGFLLLLPDDEETTLVEEAPKSEKLFHVLKNSYRWSDMLEVPNVGALNGLICQGKTKDLILMQEALQEKEIGKIAEAAARDGKRLVMIAGPSSSGKTTFSHRLATQFRALGYQPHPIAVDNYFKNRSEYPRDEYGNLDMEALGCVDIERFNQDMQDLLSGKTVELPRFNFSRGEREAKGEPLRIGERDVLLIEGIHCLNDELTYRFSADSKFRIYISALTQLNIDEHNRIPTTDGRLLRRLVRDARTRGTSAEETFARWSSVRRGEDRNIFPHQEQADVMFNSALVYEFAVLKLYAEPLLFGISRQSPHYEEAKRILKFLDYFLAMDSEYVPKNSILREFIGGSWIKV